CRPQQRAAASAQPSGSDGPRVRAWIAQRQGGDADAICLGVLSGGRSNLSFTVTYDCAPRWVLRRPPLGHTGGSAHDVQREGRIMAAMGPTPVPVPNVLEIVDDADVLRSEERRVGREGRVRGGQKRENRKVEEVT